MGAQKRPDDPMLNFLKLVLRPNWHVDLTHFALLIVLAIGLFAYYANAKSEAQYRGLKRHRETLQQKEEWFESLTE